MQCTFCYDDILHSYSLLCTDVQPTRDTGRHHTETLSRLFVSQGKKLKLCLDPLTHLSSHLSIIFIILPLSAPSWGRWSGLNCGKARHY